MNLFNTVYVLHILKVLHVRILKYHNTFLIVTSDGKEGKSGLLLANITLRMAVVHAVGGTVPTRNCSVFTSEP